VHNDDSVISHPSPIQSPRTLLKIMSEISSLSGSNDSREKLLCDDTGSEFFAAATIKIESMTNKLQMKNLRTQI
jgi:hypothetical protein